MSERIDPLRCNECGEDMKYSGSYTDARRGQPKLYDQWYCSKCKKKRTIRASGKEEEEKVDPKVTIKQESDGTQKLYGFVGSIEELISTAGIDLNVWEVKEWKIGSGRWEIPMKIKSGPNENRIETPHVETARRFNIQVVLVPKKGIIDKDRFRAELIEDVRNYAPKVHKLVRKSVSDPHLMLLNLYDLHLDKVAWHEETGHNWDMKIARRVAINAIKDLIAKSAGFPVEKILVPVGHDFFNSDSSYPYPMTTKGTPQESDSRYQNVFRSGRELWVEIIDVLRSIAPVDVELVPGNHDEERSFYLVDALGCYYHNDPEVNVNDSPMPRKYYQYYKNLFGLTHGKDIRPEKYPLLMARESPQLWADTSYRYWKLGHLHHKKRFMMISSEDMDGIEVDFLPSLTPSDAWHFSKGFTGSIRKATCEMYNPRTGKVGEFFSVASE